MMTGEIEGQGLERSLTLRGAVTLNLLDMIGVGPFLTLPLLLATMGGPQAMLGWVLGAGLAACDGLVWAELGAAMPEAGGTYAYLGKMFPGQWGRWLSFLFVFQLCVSAPLSVASGCIGLAQYAGFLAPGFLGSGGVVHALHVGAYSFGVTAGRATMLAIAAVVLAVVLLYRRLAKMGGLSTGMLVVVLGTIGWSMVTGLLHGHWSRVVAVPAGAWRLDHGFFVGMGSAMLIATYDYWGYYNVTFLGGETRDPGRTIPRAVLISIGIVAVLYLGLNASVLSVMGAPAMIATQGVEARRALLSDFMQVAYAPSLRIACGVMAAQAGGGAGDDHGVCERVFAAAGVFEDSVCSGSGWELSGGVWEAASYARVSLCVAAGVGGCCVCVLLFLAGGCDCGAGGVADFVAVWAAACGGDGAAGAKAGDAAAVSDVVVPGAAAAGVAGVWIHRGVAAEF